MMSASIPKPITTTSLERDYSVSPDMREEDGQAVTSAETIIPQAPDSDAVNTGLDVGFVAELVTRTLRGLHKVNGHLVRTDATLSSDGIIAVEVARVRFGGEDVTVRVMLHPIGAQHATRGQ